MNKSKYFVVTFGLLASFHFSFAAENPFAAFKGRYKVISERCFNDVYKHPGFCKANVKELSILPESDGHYVIVEGYGDRSERINVSERNDGLVRVSGSASPRSAEWRFFERTQDSESTRQHFNQISLSDQRGFVVYTNETEVDFMRTGETQFPIKYFLRALELQRIDD